MGKKNKYAYKVLQQQQQSSIGQEGDNFQLAGPSVSHRQATPEKPTQQRSPGPQQPEVLNAGHPQQSAGHGQQQQSKIRQKAESSQQQRGGPPQRGDRQPNQKPNRSFHERGPISSSGILEVNYLELDLENMPEEAYQYDVTITPERPKTFLRPAFRQCRQEKFGDIVTAYDGKKNCYSVQRLPVPIDHIVQVIDSSNRMKEFKVEIKETKDCVVNLNKLQKYRNKSVSEKPMHAIQVLDVVFAENNYERGLRVGRSFFHKPNNPFNLGGGLEAWTGLFQAVILGEQLYLNIDITHKSFPRKSSIVDYLRNQNIQLHQQFDKKDLWNVSHYLKGIDIEYKPPPSFKAVTKKYRVLGIDVSACDKRFKNDDGVEMTIEVYFRSRGYQLKYPKLNCLKVGSTVRSIFLPMELCSIPEGQVLNRKDDPNQTKQMVKHAAFSPNIRKEKIMEVFNYFQHNESTLLRAFGIRIGSKFIEVPMRNLLAPLIEYMEGKTIMPNRGAWNMNGLQFLQSSAPQGGHKWGIIYEKKPNLYENLLKFTEMVVKVSSQLNMNLQKKAKIITYSDVKSTLSDLSKQGYDLVFVVLGNDRTRYAEVKQSAELEVGILTQCIKENNIIIHSARIISNILLKVNTKLNGINHKIAEEMEFKNVMFLGADVTHPSPDQRHIPSVVGVVASYDQFGACYNSQLLLQKSKQEEIEDMESVVIKHLQAYKKHRTTYPEKIIYYRDGVSDGQFPKIKTIELMSIKRACIKLDCQPKLTCVIVVKRHHTRFFQKKQEKYNVSPGTVVDQLITHPNEVQFFMVSHNSSMGTARPTRYNVIEDESELDINLLQKLTYNLCHLYSRCNQAVSYPAPAYLAHLVAFRGRVYLEGSDHFSEDLKNESEKRKIKHDFMDSNPMYFV